MFHLLGSHKPAREEVSYETDRLRFIGRGRTAADPQALHDDAALAGSAGPVLRLQSPACSWISVASC